MSSLFSVYSRVVALSFFRQNAIFLGIILYITLGFVRPNDHVQLNEAVLEGGLLWLYFMVWTGYNIVVLFHFKQCLQKEDGYILYHLFTCPPREKITTLALTIFTLLLPALLYAGFVASIAIRLSMWGQLCTLLLFFTATLAYSLWYTHQWLQNPSDNTARNWSVLPHFRKSPFSFYFFELLHTYPIPLWIGKTLSIVIYGGLLYIFKSDSPDDMRPVLLAMLLASAVNFPLVGSYHLFENQTLLYFKNLPRSKQSIGQNAIGSIALLALPELLVTFRHYSPAVFLSGNALVFVVLPAMLLLIYALHFYPASQKESFANWWFVGYAVFFFAILFKWPLAVYVLLLLLPATFVFCKYFDNYEYLIQENKAK